MNETENIRAILSELDEYSPAALLNALIQTHRDLCLKERARQKIEDSFILATTQQDLYYRRCQIAMEVCRDDEHGLTMDKLNLLADVIWPTDSRRQAVDLSKPTPILPLSTKLSAMDLLDKAVAIIAAIKSGLPLTYEMGELLQKQIDDWAANIAQFKLEG